MMKMKRPFGEIEEYDLLETLADDTTVNRSLEIADATPWGLCRCRMAAIIENTVKRFGWNVAGDEAQRRVMVYAKWRAGQCAA